MRKTILLANDDDGLIIKDHHHNNKADARNCVNLSSVSTRLITRSTLLMSFSAAALSTMKMLSVLQNIPK